MKNSKLLYRACRSVKWYNMRVLSFLLLVGVLLFASCDKQKRTAKKLEGEWNIVSYKLQDVEGLSEYATVEGVMNFEKCTDHLSTPCPYKLNISYVFPSLTGGTNQNGTFQVIEKGDYMDITTLDQNNVNTSTYTYRILVQTRTDLQLEFSDSIGYIHTYVFYRGK